MILHYTRLRMSNLFSVLIAAAILLPASFNGKLCAQLPPNIDFSAGNFNNWTCWVGVANRGTLTTGTFFDVPAVSLPIGGTAPGPNTVNKSRHFITSGPDSDFYGGFPIVSPTGGTYSLRIGNDSTNNRADRVQYYIHVPSGTTSYNLQCQFAAVLQDGSHNPDEQPTFQVIAYDSSTGAVVPAANNLYIAQYAIPGFTLSQAPGSFLVSYLPWTTSTINLSGMGGKTVILECTALDCMWGGHFGYGYFDVTGSSDSLMASIISYSGNEDSVLLQGPPGYKTYQWYNQDFSQTLNDATDTARTKSFPTPPMPQYYNLIITPYAVNGVSDTIHTPQIKAKVSRLQVAAARPPAAKIYPNPSSATLHISFPSPFEGSISLLNAAGERVYHKTIPKSSSLDIPANGLAAGIYTLTLEDRQGMKNAIQVVIKH